MTDPRHAPTTSNLDQDAAEVRPDDDETHGRTETDTHTAALQGAAAGGAMGGNAGYLGGLLTGSQDGIGIADIPDAEEPTED
jgi:hypothetical protein